MAELFLARAVGPEGFEKVVVLKRVLPHFAENPRFVRSFLDEAKLVAGFDHPNIAHVYDMGMADGSYFFTMEFVQGIELRSILKRCSHDETVLPTALTILVVRNISSALHYAHERRDADGKLLDVVHRDVSPSNIIVSFEGGPKLIDFGVAKAASSSIKTQTGALKGKISYMSPEQAKGAAIDRRTDIFALGIVLWEMLTCRRLYRSDNDMATIQRIIYEPPPSPRRVRPEIPVELERIVLRALELDINKRYQTAQQLELALEEYAHEKRIKQSTIELNAYMQTTFARELKASQESQASAPTVTDAKAYPDDATESDSEFPAHLPLSEDESDLPVATWLLPKTTLPPSDKKTPYTPNAEPPTDKPTPYPPPQATGIVLSVRPRRTPWIVGAVAVILLIGAVAATTLRSTDAPNRPLEAPATSSTPQAPVPAPVPVTQPVAVPATTEPVSNESTSLVKKQTRPTKQPAKKEPIAKKEPAVKKEHRADEPKKDAKPAKPYDPNDVFPPAP